MSAALDAIKHNQFLQAEKELRKVLDGDPKNSAALLKLPYVLLKLNRPEEAIVEALKLTVSEPTNPDGWTSLGACQTAAGKPMQAAQSYQMDLKLDPNQPKAGEIRSLIKSLEISTNNSNLIGNSANDYFQSTLAHPFRWSTEQMPLKVYVQPSIKVDGYRPEFLPILKLSFDEWAHASGGKFRFIFVPERSGADIAVRWTADRKALMESAENGDVTLHEKSKTPQRVDIVLFTKDHYDDAPLTRDLALMTDLHEIGHALGFTGHSQNARDIMYGFSGPSPVIDFSQRDKNTIAIMCDDILQMKWLGEETIKTFPWTLTLLEKSFGAHLIEHAASESVTRAGITQMATSNRNWGLFNKIEVDSKIDVDDPEHKLRPAHITFDCRRNTITKDQVIKCFGKPDGRVVEDPPVTLPANELTIVYLKKDSKQNIFTLGFTFKASREGTMTLADMSVDGGEILNVAKY